MTRTTKAPKPKRPPKKTRDAIIMERAGFQKLRIPPVAVRLLFADRRSEATANGDSVINVSARSQYDLVQKLRNLADVIAGTEDSMELSGEVFVLVRRAEPKRGE